jgi:hypothetical protein
VDGAPTGISVKGVDYEITVTVHSIDIMTRLGRVVIPGLPHHVPNTATTVCAIEYTVTIIT